MNEAVQARVFHKVVPALVLAAVLLRWPMPFPAWSHFDETAFVVLPLGFWGGDLNPHYFNYPTFHFYLTSICYYLAWMVGWGVGASHTAAQHVAYQYLVDGSDVLAVARAVGAALSAATVMVLALLGRRLFDPLTGLLAASMLAVMPLATRFAPLANTDTPALFWTVMALLWAVRARQSGVFRDVLLAGVFIGLSAATKYPAVLVAVPVTVALADGLSSRSVGRIAWCALAALLAFCAASPYVWLDFAVFHSHFSDMAGTHLLAPAQISVTQQLLETAWYACGVGGLLAVAVGLGLAVRSRTWRDAVVLSAGLVTIVLLLTSGSYFIRYALPLAPPLCLLLARGLAVFRRRPHLLLILAIVVVLEPLYVSLASWRLLSGPDTRSEAQAWIAQQAPSGAWLDEPESACGQIDLLRPAGVFVRQAHFVRSYGIEPLHAAYQHLATRPDLPALFPPGARATPGVRRLDPGTPVMAALRLHYEHPLCGQTGEAPTTEVRVFDPGPMQETGFDQQDWYFLPTRKLRAVDTTGPRVTVQGQPPNAHPAVRSAEFFEVLSWTIEAALEARRGNPDSAIMLYERVLAAWPQTEAVVGAQVAAGIHTQIARLHRELRLPSRIAR